MWPWYWVSIDREMIFWITFNGTQPHSERVIYDTLLVWPWPSLCSKLFKKNSGGHQSSFGMTNTPVFVFWWCLQWVSKPGCTPSLAYFVINTQQNPQIHLWCDTCWPLGSQHCSWAIPIHILANKHWWGLRLGSIVHAAASHCETRQTLYRLSHANSASWYSNLIWILYITVCRKHEVPSSSGSKFIAQIKTQAQLKILHISAPADGKNSIPHLPSLCCKNPEIRKLDIFICPSKLRTVNYTKETLRITHILHWPH